MKIDKGTKRGYSLAAKYLVKSRNNAVGAGWYGAQELLGIHVSYFPYLGATQLGKKKDICL